MMSIRYLSPCDWLVTSPIWYQSHMFLFLLVTSSRLPRVFRVVVASTGLGGISSLALRPDSSLVLPSSAKFLIMKLKCPVFAPPAGGLRAYSNHTFRVLPSFFR
jgi:hypothetical protein